MPQPPRDAPAANGTVEAGGSAFFVEVRFGRRHTPASPHEMARDMMRGRPARPLRERTSHEWIVFADHAAFRRRAAPVARIELTDDGRLKLAPGPGAMLPYGHARTFAEALDATARAGSQRTRA